MLDLCNPVVHSKRMSSMYQLVVWWMDLESVMLDCHFLLLLLSILLSRVSNSRSERVMLFFFGQLTHANARLVYIGL
jgi:hypothetical protein